MKSSRQYISGSVAKTWNLLFEAICCTRQSSEQMVTRNTVLGTNSSKNQPRSELHPNFYSLGSHNIASMPIDLPITIERGYNDRMNKIQRKVGSIMDNAESLLGSLIQTALQQKRYDDVSFVAAALNQLAKARKRLQLPGIARNLTAQDSSGPDESDTGPVGKDGSLSARTKLVAHGSSGPKPQTLAKSSKYPLFFRDDSRLIKVGCSKKNKDEYVHRVPKDAALAFAEHLDKCVDADSIFEIENLFPISTPSGEQVPSYQIYVVIAWLRDANVIEKKGRDGYVILEKSKLIGGFNELWEALQTRTT